MNSKQRVLNTIENKPADKIPINFSANKWVREKLCQQHNFKNHLQLLNFFHSDVVDLRDCVSPPYVGPEIIPDASKDDISENYWGWQTKVIDTPRGKEEQFCGFKLQNVSSVNELKEYRWPEVSWFDFSDFESRILPYQDLCVVASGASVFQHATFLRSMDTLLTDLYLNPEIAGFLMDKYTDFYLAYFEKMFQSANGKIDIFRVADDVAMQTGLLIDPKIFDSFIAPRLKKLIDLAHNYGLKFMLHSCGDVSTLIPKFIELGVDILDPVQVSASNMNLFEIHEKYRHKIGLNGGIDTQKFLPNASEKEIRAKIRETIDYFENKSGYILSTTHVIEGDITPENIFALFDEGFNYQNLKATK